VEQDLDRVRVRRHDDELGDTPVQRLGRLVCALFKLFVVRRLLYKVKDLIEESRQGQSQSVRRHP
jgi:hypothetical protein